jgi:hypothetical protein
MTREHRKTASLANNISMGEAGQGGVIEEDFDVTDYTIALESNIAGILSSGRSLKIE